MDPERWRRIETIYHGALACPAPERHDFLERECRGDTDLRSLVVSLLGHEADSGDLLTPVHDDALNVARLASMPESVGSYRVIRTLGEGGMGVVYEAEQQHPRRLVAVKVIRGGPIVDRTQIQLFEREAQALARLKHPGVAAIYESGLTDEGQHYFAMELVHGRVLDAHIERLFQHGPPPRQALLQSIDLFLKICDVVAYAHQRAIIHRDLKPSNIMVIDGEDLGEASAAVSVKVLDFGLARFTDDPLAGTLMTHAGAVRGTLGYMSPEQVRGNPDDIDVRTDVYSLGMILFELACGDKPYTLRNLSFFDAARVICEAEPSLPPSAAVDDDLKAVIWKALEKDPARRYQTVAAMADDLTRYVRGLPVTAKRPSAAYHLNKFVRRHTIGVTSGVCAAVAIVLVAVVMTLQARRLAIERDRANREAAASTQIADFLIGLFNVADPGEARGNTVTAREILDRGAASIPAQLGAQPLVAARLQTVIGRVYHALGLFDRAQPLLQSALSTRQRQLRDDDPEVAEGHDLLARVLRDKGQYAAAEAEVRTALATRRSTLGPKHPAVAEALNDLGSILFEKGDLAGAEQTFRDALAIRRETLGDSDDRTADSLNDLAIAIENRSADYKTVIALQREVLKVRRARWTSDHPELAQAINNLGMAYYRNHQFAEGEPLFREALAMNRRLLGDGHPEVATNLHNLGLLLRDKGDLAAAEASFHQALDIDRQVRGPEHPATIGTLVSLAAVMNAQRNAAGAESLLREALKIQLKIGENAVQIATTRSLLGETLTVAKRFSEAESLLLPSYAFISQRFGVQHPRSQAIIRRIIAMYEAWGRQPLAQRYKDLQSPPS